MAKRLYHFDKQGNRHSVVKQGDDLVTDEGVRVNGRVTTNPNGPGRHSFNDNPYHGTGSGEWDDYAHTADDL